MSKDRKNRQIDNVQPTRRLELEAPQESVSIPVSREVGLIHVELYLRAKAVKLWERGGMIAYAHANGKQFDSEKNFDELFRSY
jgi:hypothetical protein